MVSFVIALSTAVLGVTWSQLDTTTGSVAFSEHASGWDPVNQRLVVFNRDGEMYGLNGDTWAVIAPSGGGPVPAGRFSMVYGVDDTGLVISCGEGNDGTFYNDVWRFRFADTTWEQLAPPNAAGSPETRYGAAGGVFQQGGSHNLLVTHGFATKRYSNMFTFDLTSLQWNRIEKGTNEYSLGFPHARCLAPGTVTQTGEVFLFGGCLSGGSTGGPCPSWDGWCRDAGGDWHRITDGDLPTPRTRGLMVPYPPQPGRALLITSGTTSTGNQWLEGEEEEGGDIGVVDCAERKWTFSRPTGAAPPRLFNAAAAWNSTHIFISGGVNGDTGSAAGTAVWTLSWATGFDSTPTTGGTGSYLTLVMLHGIFMFLAWGIMCPVGAFCARYLKEKDPLWFKLHRIMMPVGLLFTLVGLGLIIPSVLNGHFQFAHGAIGLVVVILAILQPINAVLRPHKAPAGEEKPTRRLIWELLHKWAGRLALMLGLINLILGVLIAVAPREVFIVTVVWCSLMVLVWVAAEVFFRVRYGPCSDWKAVIEEKQQKEAGTGPDEEPAAPEES